MGPRERPRECPRKPPREPPPELSLPVLSPLKTLTKVPTKRPTKVSTPRRCPRKVSSEVVGIHLSCFHLFCFSTILVQARLGFFSRFRLLGHLKRLIFQSRTCAINNFWTKIWRGCLGEGRGGHAKLFMLGFSPMFEVFSGPPTGLT